MTSQTGREREPSPLEEELVAYLDDELDGDARRRLERRLADEPTVRESLRKLTRVWDALEKLPRAEVSDSFATTTVEAVVLSEGASQANSLVTQFRGKRDWWLKRGVALAACVLASFVAVSLFWPDPNQQLAEELPILQNLAAYRHVESIEYLKLLAQANLFPKDDETPASSAPAVPTTAGTLTLIANMPEGERAAVARSRQEFAKIPSEAERTQLRLLEKALSQEPDQAELRRVLARYGAWLKTINAGQSSQLSEIKDASQRMKRVKEMLEADLRAADREVVWQWLNDYAEKHEDALLKSKPKTNVSTPKLHNGEQMRRHWEAVGVLLRAMDPPGREDDLPFDEYDFVVLESKLSPEPAKRLRECQELDLKRMALAAWWRAGIQEWMERAGRGAGSRAESKDKYEQLFTGERQLETDEKYRIFMLPPDQAKRELTREWWERYGGPQFGGPGGPGGPGGFGPPGRPPSDRGGRRGPGDRDHDDEDRDGRRDGDRDRRDRKNDDHDRETSSSTTKATP